MNVISKNQIIFDPVSLVDPFGRVFYFKNEVYRAVNPPYESLCNDILSNAETWAKYGLVMTRKAKIALDGYPLTIWHQRINYKNYCMEWLPEMFKDAATMFLKLNRRLIEDGFICKDAHPWNVFFDFSVPIYIDIGSIVRHTQEMLKACIHEFILYFLLPLILFERERSIETYRFLKLPIPNKVLRENLIASIPDVNISTDFEASNPLNFLDNLLEYIASIKVGREFEVERDRNTFDWGSYEQKEEISYKRPDEFIPKQRAVYDFLLMLPRGEVLDIGCNKGWFSFLSEMMGHKVLSIDNNIPALTKLYASVRSNRLNILPLYVDFKYPTPSHGINGVYSAFEERFRFDIVLAMAMIHHLTYSSKMTFEQIADRIAKLSKKYLIIEFIPKEDYHVSQWAQTGMEWYERKNFINSFLRYFKDYKVVKSSPDPREVFLFSK